MCVALKKRGICEQKDTYRFINDTAKMKRAHICVFVCVNAKGRQSEEKTLNSCLFVYLINDKSLNLTK
jgi:hypothetical protein